MKQIVTVLLAITLLAGCSTLQYPECNEKYATASMLASIANDHQICLQDVARNTTSVALIAVAAEPGIAKGAREGAERIVEALNYNVTDVVFRDMVTDNFRYAALVDLITINSDYLDGFSTGAVMDAESRLLIQQYFVNDLIPRLKRYEQLAQ